MYDVYGKMISAIGEFCFTILHRPREESLTMLLSRYFRRPLVCVYAMYIVMSLDKAFQG